MISFFIARAIPESDRIVGIFIKEGSKVLLYCDRLQLIRIREWIKNLSCSIDGISDNNNIYSILDLDSLIDTISNCKQFYLCKSDIDNIMDCFS